MYKNDGLYITTDFNNISPNVNKLSLEILHEQFSVEFYGISTNGIDYNITFANPLQSSEVTTLNNLVHNHVPTIPFPLSSVTTPISTTSSSSYQTANTVRLYVLEARRFRFDVNLRIFSTLTGIDYRLVIGSNVLYTCTQGISTGLLSIPLTMTFLETATLQPGIYDVELQFRRSSALSSSTINDSKILCTVLDEF